MAGILSRLFGKKQKSDNGITEDKKLKILLYGDVNLNLIDGSSIWLNSLVQVLALEPGFHITVLLKAKVETNRLIADLKKLENANIIDTYRQFSDFSFLHPKRLAVDDALKIMRQIDREQHFDCILLRGYELCEKAPRFFENPARIIPYITNFTHDPSEITPEEVQRLKRIFDPARVVFAQTEEMKEMLSNLLGYQDGKICILTPMIQNLPKEKLTFRNLNNTLVYTGKFSNDYMLYETLQAFGKINNGSYKFNIAGDKFHLDLKVPKEKLISIMQEMHNVYWAEGLIRDEVSRLIESSDLGLCWRSTRIDNEKSLELSTKVLEYGRLGKPVLIRRIPIHERLLGEDYPFYVESENDLVEKIELAFQDSVLYEKAAKRIYEVSHYYTFNNAIKRISPYLMKFSNSIIRMI